MNRGVISNVSDSSASIYSSSSVICSNTNQYWNYHLSGKLFVVRVTDALNELQCLRNAPRFTRNDRIGTINSNVMQEHGILIHRRSRWEKISFDREQRVAVLTYLLTYSLWKQKSLGRIFNTAKVTSSGLFYFTVRHIYFHAKESHKVAFHKHSSSIYT